MMQSTILFPKGGKDHLYFWLLFGSLSVLVIASLVVYIGIFVRMTNRLEELDEPFVYSKNEIPTKYAIPWESITPVKDQQSRGTCWIFATMAFLEAAYNKEAKEKHGHPIDSYVRFSEQAYGIKMVDTCQVENPSKYCTNGQRWGTPTDGLPEWLYYFNDVNKKWALPENLCPYYGTEDEWDICPDINQKLEKNPIEFTIDNITSVYTIADIKKLMIETQLPVTWSHSVFNKVYKTKCSQLKNQSVIQQCVDKSMPCGDDYCYEIMTSSYDNNGVFDLTGKVYAGGGHSMAIVGWNDDFRVNRNSNHRKINEYSKGGFIIRNSWGHGAHSIGYFLSNHSTVQEDALCPNFNVYQNWIPMDYECFKTSMDAKECTNGFYRIVQLKRYEEGTILQCTKTAMDPAKATAMGFDFCSLPENQNKTWRFALQSERNKQAVYSSQPMVKVRYTNHDEGQGHFYLMAWEEGSNEVIEIVTDPTTPLELEKLFTPVVTHESTHYCGYYFIPYDVFKFSNLRRPKYGDDTPTFSTFGITFDESSFLDAKDKKENANYNYEAIQYEVDNNKFEPLNFKGPYIRSVEEVL